MANGKRDGYASLQGCDRRVFDGVMEQVNDSAIFDMLSGRDVMTSGGGLGEESALVISAAVTETDAENDMDSAVVRYMGTAEENDSF